MSSKGIDEEGIPTIDVLGHEVPLPAYWRIVDLHDQGISSVSIVATILQITNSNARLTVTAIVDAILENLRLIRSGPSTGLKRSTVCYTNTNASLSSPTPKKPKPNRISAYRASRLASANDLHDSLMKLESAQKEEDKLVEQALMLLAKKENVSKSPLLEANEKRKEEAVIDLDMRRTLKRHKAAEAEVEYAKVLVRLGKASLV